MNGLDPAGEIADPTRRRRGSWLEQAAPRRAE
jgi:hypothetical protein